MNILITFILKIFILKFFMTFYKMIISILKFNESKTSSRSALIINFFFELI